MLLPAVAGFVKRSTTSGKILNRGFLLCSPRTTFGGTRPRTLYQRSLRTPSAGHLCSAAKDTNSDITRDAHVSSPEPMTNLYQEWTIDDDRLLWENRKESTSTLASLLGRGLRGVETRLSKLKDVNSMAYGRLFCDQKSDNCSGSLADPPSYDKKLIPVSEVLRRIKWDDSLLAVDFSVLHYDRVDDKVVESPFDAPNTSISSKATSLTDALPEHRIVGIKYKERVVWDRERRMDLVFSSPGIERIIANYDEWKRRKDATLEFYRQRQAQVSEHLQQILGFERFASLKEISKQLLVTSEQDGMSLMFEVEKYVRAALDLFREIRRAPESSLAPTLIPISEYQALDKLSELVALLPDSKLRPTVLTEISRSMQRVSGKKTPPRGNQDLPDLDEDDLTETFVRGTGPGGQKVNKTSNRVVLVHNPTGVRVECQETRSLQQNRKLARKRLRLKLDEYINGSQSRTSLKAKKMASKKSRAKSRSRARQRQKREAKNAAVQDADPEGDNWY